MKPHAIEMRSKRKFAVTTDSQHRVLVVPNLLAREFSPSAHRLTLCSEITYIATKEGSLHLDMVNGPFSRQMMGWSMQPQIPVSVVADALRLA